ncbi:hypothetical protein [Tunicatimonas pelagia]|uniref:hypothetical protein n=1 Tax=Tunicatimonas pelagia TaxID=931531 RepID=UPI00266701B4|nr:hypothetical protein [Tunicatimonas pelagia]WKN43009.1 hypothetical protein P0M28_28630 [Tunicatimonas pelagia]
METMQDFDRFLLELHRRIEENPEQKWRILLQAQQETSCPFLKRRIKRAYNQYLEQP